MKYSIPKKQKGERQVNSRSRSRRIYLDHAATTPIDQRVLEAMRPFLTSEYGNPGGIYKEGVCAKRAVEDSREKVASLLKARSDEIIFTGSGTEANNLAIFGFAQSLIKEGVPFSKIHCITSVIEHSSVREVFNELEGRGARIGRAEVSREGVVKVDEIKNLLHSDTHLVSVMYANNEIGTIQPISEISKMLRNFRKGKGKEIKSNEGDSSFPFFHCDASNVPSYIPLNIEKLGADMITLDAQKIYGPKGVGMLYKKKNVPLEPLLYGGAQEHGMRGGTENVPAIVGFAKALEIAAEEREKESARLIKLRDYFIREVLAKIPHAELNGDPEDRLPNNANFSFFLDTVQSKPVDSEWVVLGLDARGIAAGMRSACLSDDEGSYVVAALGKGKAYSKNSVRFTLGRNTTKEELKYVAKALTEIVNLKSDPRTVKV